MHAERPPGQRLGESWGNRWLNSWRYTRLVVEPNPHIWPQARRDGYIDRTCCAKERSADNDDDKNDSLHSVLL